jgi:hypothetical protein
LDFAQDAAEFYREEEQEKTVERLSELFTASEDGTDVSGAYTPRETVRRRVRGKSFSELV